MDFARNDSKSVEYWALKKSNYPCGAYDRMWTWTVGDYWNSFAELRYIAVNSRMLNNLSCSGMKF